MRTVFNPLVPYNFDELGSDPLGTLDNPFPSTGLYQYSADGSILWLMTLDNAGNWVATNVTPAPRYASLWGLFANIP